MVLRAAPALHDGALEDSRAGVFRAMTPAAFRAAVAAARRRSVAAGATLFHEGDDAREAHVLVEGRFKMTQLDRDGQEILLHFVDPGELFGCVSLLDQPAYPATARAVADSVVLSWPGPTVKELMLRHGPIASNVLAYVGSRMLEFQDRFREIATQRVEQRLARALMRLVRASGERDADGIRLAQRVSRADLADMTGTTVYSASRVLSAWERRGLIETKRREIVIRRLHELVAVAEDLPPQHGTLR